MTTIWLLVMLVLVYIVTALITGIVRQYAIKHSMIDVPSHRSSHDNPTPRGGGISLVIVSILGMAGLIYSPIDSSGMVIMLAGSAIMAFIGFLDDY